MKREMSMVLPAISGIGPKLRAPLEFNPVLHEGRQLIVLRDPSGVASEIIGVPIELAPVLMRLDGQHSIDEIAREGSVAGITKEVIQELVQELTKEGYLETPDISAKLATIKQTYLDLVVRPAQLAGIVYPEPREELEELLRNIVKRADNRFVVDGSADVRAVICPHIDYQRGWQGYGSAFSVLSQCKKPDLIVLIGTSHYGGESIFQLGRKDFQVPNGTLKVAKEALAQLSAIYGEERSYRDEFLHKREHSLELQVPFILEAYRDQTAPEILPVLVGTLHPSLVSGCSPKLNSEVSDFIGGLAEVIRSYRSQGKRVLLYGGIDLSHMGRYFGDSETVCPDQLPTIEMRDRLLLEAVLAADEEALFQHMAEDLDKRRVCGFPTLYTMLAVMRECGDSTKGHLIDYRQAVTAESDCVVSFASACWTA